MKRLYRCVIQLGNFKKLSYYTNQPVEYQDMLDLEKISNIIAIISLLHDNSIRKYLMLADVIELYGMRPLAKNQLIQAYHLALLFHDDYSINRFLE